MRKQVGDAPYGGQTEAEAFFAIALRISDLVELVENLFPLVLGNADAGVPDFERDLAAPVATANQHSPSCRVAERVGHKIRQNALKQERIAMQYRACRCEAKVKLVFARSRGVQSPQLLEQVGCREMDEIGLDIPCVQFGNVEQFVEQRLERVDRRQDLVDRFRAARRALGIA